MSDQADVRIRFTVVAPPADVTFGVQHARNELVSLQRSTGDDLSFALDVRARWDEDGTVDFSGPPVQGRKGERFVYLNSGKQAGDQDSCWDRRAKIMLSGSVSSDQVRAAVQTGSTLEARFDGKAADGGPCCARIAPFDGAWRVEQVRA